MNTQPAILYVEDEARSRRVMQMLLSITESDEKGEHREPHPDLMGIENKEFPDVTTASEEERMDQRLASGIDAGRRRQRFHDLYAGRGQLRS